MKYSLAINISIAAAGLGLSPLAKKAALNGGVAPLPLSLAVVLVGATVVLGYTWRTSGPAALRQLSGTTLLHLFVIGALGSAAVTVLSSVALTETTATNRSLFQAMYPVATAVCARLILGERFPAGVYGVIIVMCCGLFLMNLGKGGLEAGFAVWLLAATLPLIGLADVYSKRVLGDTDPEVVAFGRLLFGGCALLPVIFWTGRDEWLLLAGQSTWVILAGALSAGGVIGLYRSLETESASMTAAFIALAPTLTVVAEWLLLGSRFRLLQLAGVVLVVGGAIALARLNQNSSSA